MNRLQTALHSLGLMERPVRKGVQAAPLLGGIGVGAGAGALLMYVLDPMGGKRRRSLAKNQMTKAVHVTSGALESATRDFTNRAKGTLAESMKIFDGHPASDGALEARIRSRMGHILAQPGRIEVTVSEGHVTLSGRIMAGEQKALLRMVKSMKGVHSIENRLLAEVMLDSTRQRGRNGRWTPTGRLAAGLTGTALLAYGMSRRGALGAGLGMTGAGLLARGLSNVSTRGLVGMGTERRGIRIDKSINIHAPVQDVFGFWANYENFPLFMRNVLEVTDLGDGLSHWKVAGLAGSTFQWDAQITDWRENDVISWQSRPGSIVGNAGAIRFITNPDGTTRVDVHLSYEPPAGALGHLVASLFHSDPKSEMDEDLNRMKTMIETGHAPHDAADSMLRDIQESHA